MFSALEIFLGMRYINLLFTYLLTYSRDVQLVVRVAPLMEIDCTSPSVTAETVDKTPLTSAKVKTRDESDESFLVINRDVKWPRGQNFALGLGLGLRALALASALASNIWPRSRSRPRDFGFV